MNPAPGKMPPPPIFRAIVSFILIAVISFVLIQFFAKKVEDDLADQFAESQEAITRLIAVRIEEFFAEVRKDLSIFAQRDGIISGEPRALRKDMAELYKSFYGVATTTSRMDTLGYIVYSQPDTSVIGQNIAHQTHVRKLIEEHCEVVSQPIYTIHGYIAIVVHQPIFDADSNWRGSITALIPFEAVEKELLAELANIDAIGWIVDSTGEILYHPDLATGTLVERAYSSSSSELLESFIEALPREFYGRGEYIDHSGKRKLLGIATINLGDYHWYVATSGRSDKYELIAAKIHKMANFGYGLLILVLFGGYLYFGHFVLGKRIREFRRIRESTCENKNRIIELFSKGVRSLITNENEREALQMLVSNIREVGGFLFAGLFVKRDNFHHSLAAQAYRDESNYDKFLDFSDIDPFTVKVYVDRLHPLVQSLMRGETVKVVSMEQVSLLDIQLANMGHALYRVFGNCSMFIIPVRAKGELIGELFCCVERDQPLLEELLAPFIDQVAEVLQMSYIHKQLRDANEMFADIFQNVEDGIFILDSEMRLTSYNSIAASLFGLSRELIGAEIGEVFNAVNSSDSSKIYSEAVRNGNSIEIEEAVFDEHGEAKYLLKRIIPLFSSAGVLRRIITIIRNVSNERKLSDELNEANRQTRNLATNDDLTGISNYRHFMYNLPHFMKMAKDAGAPLCLIILDLDDIKRVNDRWGQSCGDQILRNVAKIISDKCLDTDFFGRYGGDDFAILIRNSTPESAVARAEIIRTNIEDKAGAEGAQITASFGVAVLDDSMKSADDFLHVADMALHRAKAEGKNRVCLVD